jgi:hypothetical protein
VLLVWGFSNSFPPLALFAITYSLFAGGFSVLYVLFALL